MSFLFPTLLTIGLPLVAVPVLIHLINLRRQQRIRWAAMQFLLESQRQNRRWILLKQLLLLATRMAAIAVLVLMLAHLVLRNEWLSLLGPRHDAPPRAARRQLLDERPLGRTPRALDEGKRAVQAIVDQAAPTIRSAARSRCCDFPKRPGSRPARSRRFSPSRSTTRSAASSNRCSPAGSRRRPTSARPTRSRRFPGCRWRTKTRR